VVDRAIFVLATVCIPVLVCFGKLGELGRLYLYLAHRWGRYFPLIGVYPFSPRVQLFRWMLDGMLKRAGDGYPISEKKSPVSSPLNSGPQSLETSTGTPNVTINRRSALQNPSAPASFVPTFTCCSSIHPDSLSAATR
jgi:hypothetical protein